MAKFENGSKVMVAIVSTGDKVLAGQRGATLNRSSEVIDVTNKVSNGWKESISAVKEWSIDCDGIFVKDDAALMELEKAFNEGTEVTVKIGNEDFGYTGKALITDFPLDAPYDDVMTYSMALQGNGPLTTGTVTVTKLTEE